MKPFIAYRDSDDQMKIYVMRVDTPNVAISSDVQEFDSRHDVTLYFGQDKKYELLNGPETMSIEVAENRENL
jgi:hypothetical protein